MKLDIFDLVVSIIQATKNTRSHGIFIHYDENGPNFIGFKFFD